MRADREEAYLYNFQMLMWWFIGLNTQGQPIIFRNNTVRYGSKGLLVHKTTGYGGTTTISGNYFDKNYTGAIEINSGNSAQV